MEIETVTMVEPKGSFNNTEVVDKEANTDIILLEEERINDN